MPFGSGKIWMNGTLVDWADARIHIGSHVIHYGSAVFEGARCYNTPRGAACFRLDDHVVRLLNSATHLPHGVAAGPRRRGPRQSKPTIRENAPEGLLHPADHVPGLLGARRQPAALPGRHGHHGLGMGGVPRARRAGEGRRRLRQLLEPHGAEHVPGAGQVERELRERRAHQDGGDARRLRRRHRARSQRVHQRGQRAEPVPRAGRHHLHAVGDLVDPAGHHARFGHHHRAQPRLRGPRRDAAARDALPRRRSVLRRHGRRGNAHPLDRQAGGRRRACADRSPRPSAARSSTSSTGMCPTRTGGSPGSTPTRPTCGRTPRPRSHDSRQGRKHHPACAPGWHRLRGGDRRAGTLSTTAGHPTCM